MPGDGDFSIIPVHFWNRIIIGLHYHLITSIYRHDVIKAEPVTVKPNLIKMWNDVPLYELDIAKKLMSLFYWRVKIFFAAIFFFLFFLLFLRWFLGVDEKSELMGRSDTVQCILPLFSSVNIVSLRLVPLNG